MESYCSLCTFKVPQGANNLILCTDTIQTFFVTRLIINKVQWVDFKLENVLVALHSLKTMELLGHSPIHRCSHQILVRLGKAVSEKIFRKRPI
jgi:hypothetical protein